MALLLIIDTCLETAYVALAHNDNILHERKNTVQNQHASFVHVAVEEILQASAYRFKDLDAVAVTAGPGSYTGIRVGLSAAKGFCFAAGKPLILLNTLQVLAAAGFYTLNLPNANQYTCLAVLKAREEEVYAAVYNNVLEALTEPKVLLTNNISGYLNTQKLAPNLIVAGNISSVKISIQQNFNMYESALTYKVEHLNKTAQLIQSLFQPADKLLSNPFYLKSVYIR